MKKTRRRPKETLKKYQKVPKLTKSHEEENNHVDLERTPWKCIDKGQVIHCDHSQLRIISLSLVQVQGGEIQDKDQVKKVD